MTAEIEFRGALIGTLLASFTNDKFYCTHLDANYRETFMKFKFVLSLSLFMSQQVMAADGGMSSPYSFGGACSSQGVWTQTALSGTQNLRRVTMQLRDDANCRALGSSIQSSIDHLEKSIKAASDGSARATRLSQLPQEIQALSTFVNSAPDMKKQILRLMMDKSIESATLSAQVGQEEAGLVANGLLDFGSRIQQSTRVGLTMLNDVVDSIPRLNECLVGGDQQFVGAAISTAVQVASAFASSGRI